MAALISLFLGAAWTFYLVLGRPTRRYRQCTRWAVRPGVEVVGSAVHIAQVTQILDAVGGALRPLGFEPFTSTRALLGTTAGRTVRQVQAVWLRRESSDAAILAWQQLSADGWGTSAAYVDLHFVRWLEPAGRRAAQLRLASPSPDGRRTLELEMDAGEIAVAYGRFASAPQVGATRPWRYADGAAYAAALEQAAADHMARFTSGRALPDRAGQWYVFTWRAALSIVVRRWGGQATQRPEGRGFEVVPIAAVDETR
jgi:hypothetical protein